MRGVVLGLFDQLVLGMAAVSHPLRFAQALLLTLVIWGGWLAAIVATFKAFNLEMPLAGALFMESALTLSMLVPQAPGFLGVFQVVTEEALALERQLFLLGLQCMVLLLDDKVQLGHVGLERAQLRGHGVLIQRLRRHKTTVLLQLILQVLPFRPQHAQLLRVLLVFAERCLQPVREAQLV